MAGGHNSAPVITSGHERPKDILGAISEIEILSEAEERGADMPERFATLKDRADYFTLGLKSMVIGTLISLILAPITSAVINNDLPIFGHSEPSIYDMILSYIISFGYSIGYMMLFVYLAKIRGGTVSNIISSQLMWGMTAGAIAKLIVAIAVYGLLYFIVLTKSNISHILSVLTFFNLERNTYNTIYFVITAIRNSLIPTIFIYGYTTIFIISVPWSVKIYYKIRYKMGEDV